MTPPPRPPPCCTRAITGSEHPAHQPIYVCDTCCRPPPRGEPSSSSSDDDDDDDDVDLSRYYCICRSCADGCHAGHDVRYVGDGPCTCDCDVVGGGGGEGGRCPLAYSSAIEARKLGYGEPASLDHEPPVPRPPPSVDDVGGANRDAPRCCVECRTHVGGYDLSSHTIPSLAAAATASGVDGDGDGCDDGGAGARGDLIRQAIALAGLSGDTFWLSDDDTYDICRREDDGEKHGGGGDGDRRDDDVRWCDLEMLAGAIYRHHVGSSRSSGPPSSSYPGDPSQDDDGGGGGGGGGGGVRGGGGGAEWWVQVKQPNSSPDASPVDLHYDKDENLAEIFDLGRFPSLSTVTYLTDNIDNAPTLIFPRTYADPEDEWMGGMVLSRPALGKHLAFDGRLLHGAPGHPSLLPRGRRGGRRRMRREGDGCDDVEGCDGAMAVECDDDDGGADEDYYDDGGGRGCSSLRVTFLVNIWTDRRPSGVDVLPGSIRADIVGSSIRAASATAGGAGGGAPSSSSSFRNSPPLSFERRRVSDITVPGWWTRRPEDAIVLPFVSKGATWMGDDDDDDDANDADGDDDDVEMSGGIDGDGSRTTARDECHGDDDDEGAEDEEEDDEDVEDDEDDDLFLVLSPFATSEYADDDADTFVFSFGGGDGARLVRGGDLNATTTTESAAGDNAEKSDGGEGRVATTTSTAASAIEFLSHLRERVPSFVSSVIAHLEGRYGVDVSACPADHVCYRTGSIEEYSVLVEALRADDDAGDFRLLVESDIGGRPIATFKLTTPIEIRSRDGGTRFVDVIEIPSPKDGSPYGAGLEHVEFVVGDGSHESPANGDAHRTTLTAWMEMHPSVPWNAKALGKRCNPDVSASLELPDHGRVSVKFHLMPLEEVIKFENGSMQL